MLRFAKRTSPTKQPKKENDSGEKIQIATRTIRVIRKIRLIRMKLPSEWPARAALQGLTATSGLKATASRK